MPKSAAVSECGNMQVVLYSCNLEWVGISFFRRLKTPICWLAFLQTELTCSLKLSSESRCALHNLIDFNCSMLTPSICRFIVFASVQSPVTRIYISEHSLVAGFPVPFSDLIPSLSSLSSMILDLMVVCIHRNFVISYMSKIILKWLL